MSKIYIDTEQHTLVDEIAWLDENGKEEMITYDNVCIRIINCNEDMTAINNSDIPKLQKALEKAKELGWF